MFHALWALKLKKKEGKSCPWFPVVNSCVCRSWILHILNCIDLVTWSPITIMTRACWCPINLQLSFNSAEVKLGASSVFLKVLNTPELISTNRSMVHSVMISHHQSTGSHAFIKLVITKHIFPCSLLSY